MKIARSTAQELAWSKSEDGFTVVERRFIEHSRWALLYSLVVEKEGRFYRRSYRVAATECQDERPFEYDDDPVEFEEVFPVSKTVTVYEPAPKMPPVNEPTEPKE